MPLTTLGAHVGVNPSKRLEAAALEIRRQFPPRHAGVLVAVDRIEATTKVFHDDQFVVRTRIVCEGENITSVGQDVFLENACLTSCENCLQLMCNNMTDDPDHLG